MSLIRAQHGEHSSTVLARAKSNQLVETIAAAFKSPVSTDITGSSDGGGTLSRKSSHRMIMTASPGQSGTSGRNTHTRKSRSAQLKLDLDEVSSGAALSRASSASLGLSFSFTGFTMLPDKIDDSKPFSDDDNIREERVCSVNTAITRIKDGHDFSYLHVHETWLEGYSANDDRFWF